jgi:cell division septation protein DedD
VAHPAVKDPERIIIRNPENGKFVIGALFRRERANPGPKLQVSSDAASALGLLAGKPTTLNVTALRREEEPAPPAAPAAPEVQTAAAAPAGPAASDPPPAARAEAAAPARPRRGLFDFLRPKSAPDTAEDATAAEVTAAPLEPIQSAAAALDRADAAAAPRPAPAPAAAPRPAPAAAPAPAPAPQKPAPAPQKPRATLDKPFIQIGIFSVEENASNTAAAFGRAGILPLVKAQETQGKKFWRVLVGPAPSAAERDALLKKVKAMGFTDAYFVSS